MSVGWLQDKGSMTKRLREYGEIQIEILCEDFALPNPVEQAALQLQANQKAFVREVLMLGSAPWVYARSVFHPEIGNGAFEALFHFGTRPLGELLFSDPSIARLSIQEITCPQRYLCRQSLFTIVQWPMIMTEIFLPECPLSLGSVSKDAIVVDNKAKMAKKP